MSDYVLAMYDVRGKQKYIYRSRKLKEIQGGSLIIRDIFNDHLYKAANTVSGATGDTIYRYKEGEPFSFDAFEKRMSEGKYIGEVVYDGGGNFFILYKDRDICKKVTAEFTKQVLVHASTLKVICTFTDDVHRDDFEADRSELYRRHRYDEAQMVSSVPYGTLPIVQVDPLTQMPLTGIADNKADDDKKVTAENYAKYRKVAEYPADKKIDEQVLDHIVTQKGKESLLAIVYIDGNNMGAKVAAVNRGKKSYDDCVSNLRRFSDEIQKTFIDDRMAGIDRTIEKRTHEGKRRLVLGAGDEITIICNARDALNVAENYLEELPDGYSSCAGISIFHSHTPFSDAYRIAEECCETGKKLMKEKAEKESGTAWRNACFIDFHFNQGAIGVSLDEIREHDNTADCSNPWLISGGDPEDKGIVTWQKVSDAAEVLRLFGRTNSKGLLEAAIDSKAGLNMEIQRIRGHMSEEKRMTLDGYKSLWDSDIFRELIIQMMPVYDIWFSEEVDA